MLYILLHKAMRKRKIKVQNPGVLNEIAVPAILWATSSQLLWRFETDTQGDEQRRIHETLYDDSLMLNGQMLVSICFHSGGDRSPGIYDLNRKRKLLQYELGNSGLPWPKHKVRERSGNFDHEPLILESLDEGDSPDELIDRMIGDGLEVESENDSNSFIGGSDNKMTLDVNSDTEGLSMKSFLQDQPSTSSNISASRSMRDVNNGLRAGLQEYTQHPGYRSTKDQCAGSTDDLNQHENEDVELDDETTKDTMLYSNDVAPFLLSSGRWSPGQDARMGTRKPTIDQEFEQYFSALML